jgi:hypothetical protein
MATLLAPTANTPYLTRLGNTYQSDDSGMIRDVPTGTEVLDLEAMGCAKVQPGRWPLFALIGADMTSLEDQQFTASLGPANGYTLSKVVIANASAPITVSGGIYTEPEKAGDAVVAATQSFALDGTTPGEIVVATLAPICATKCFQGALYLVMEAENAEAATCDVFIYGDVMSL